MAICGQICGTDFETKKRGFHFVDALLFYFVKFNFFDAFLSLFLKIDQISLCRRISPEKHFVDAFLEKHTLSCVEKVLKRINASKKWILAENKTMRRKSLNVTFQLKMRRKSVNSQKGGLFLFLKFGRG